MAIFHFGRCCDPKEHDQVMAKLSELTGLVKNLGLKVEKIHAEVQKLKDSLGDVDLPAEAQTALNNLETALSGLDELNPDASELGVDPGAAARRK